MAPMDLLSVYGHAYNPVGGATVNELLDPATGADLSSSKRTHSPWWGIAGIRLEYRIKDAIRLYVGVENLFDYHQCDTESPIMFPSAAGPGTPANPMDVIYIWGPLEGRRIYGGLRLFL